jgi:hypothetical protein
MVYYDTDSRLRLAREHADRLALEMRRSRGLTPDEVGLSRYARLASAVASRVERLRRRGARQAPAYEL